jgi:hypothetical protein
MKIYAEKLFRLASPSFSALFLARGISHHTHSHTHAFLPFFRPNLLLPDSFLRRMLDDEQKKEKASEEKT